jgi:PAS domain S-box-containing protein
MNNRFILFTALFVLVSAIKPGIIGGQEGISLSDKERQWVIEHPVLTVGNEMDWPPFDFAENGEPKGFAIDLTRTIADKAGFQLKFVNGLSWEELLAAFKQGKIDILPAIYMNEERKAFAQFTKDYFSQPSVVAVRADDDSVRSLADLEGRSVAAVKGFLISAALRKQLPGTRQVPVGNVLEGMKAVAIGDADAFIDSIGVMSYVARKNYIPNIKFVSHVSLEELANLKLHMAVGKNQSLLRDIIDKGIRALSDEEFDRLTRKWLRLPGDAKPQPVSGQGGVDLSETETAWLEAHPVLRLGVDPAWPPFDFVDEAGRHRGLSADMLELVSNRLGIRIARVLDLSWQEVLDGSQKREIDIVSICASTPERNRYLGFSKPLLSAPWVVVTRRSFRRISGLQDLQADRIMMAKGYAVVDLALAKFSDLRFTESATPLAGLEAVAMDQADAYVGNLGVIGHLMSVHGLNTLKVACDAGLGDQSFHIAVRSDWPELITILNKTLDAIGQDELTAVRQRWLPVLAAQAGTGAEMPRQDVNPFLWWIVPVVVAVFIGLMILRRIIDRPITEEEMARMTGARRFWLAITFSNLKISAKILIILVLVAASSVGLFGYLGFKAARESLLAESFKKLTAVREMKAQQIEDYFDTIVSQVVTFSESRTVIEAMKEFKKAFVVLESRAAAAHDPSIAADPELISYYQNEFFKRLQANITKNLDQGRAAGYIPKEARSRLLQKHYIAENSHPTGAKHKLDDPEDGSSYSAIHKAYHPIIRRYLETFGYYDIFLIDHETGHIVYSVFKEVDYATSLLTGPYSQTNFAKAFRSARNARRKGFIRLEDFEPYAPSYSAPASFIATPIFDGGKKIGVLIFQMPIDRINNIMTSHYAWKEVGLGDSGETYLVGGDGLMRNQSRFLIEDRKNYLKIIRKIGLSEDLVSRIERLGTSIGLQKVETRGTKDALSGHKSTMIFPDYRGVSVLSSYRPLDLPNVRWAIMSEIDEAEAMAPAERLKDRTLVLMILFLGAILAISFAFAKTMTRPIKVLTAKAEALAQGDLGVSIVVGGGDEIAQLGRSFDAMRKALAELIGGLEQKVEERTAELTRVNEEITSVNSVIMRWDADGNILYMNPFGLELFGYAEDEIIGKSAHGTIVPETDSSGRDLEAMVSEIVEHPEHYADNENENVCKDGSRIWMAWRNKPITDAAGDLREILTVGIDISERRKAQVKVRQQKDMLENTLESLTHPFYVIDANTYEIVVMNTAAKRHAVSGKATCHALTRQRETPCGSHEDPCPLEIIKRTKGPAVVEHVHTQENGEVLTEEVHGYPVFDDSGSVAQMIEYTLDVTDRKRVEAQLKLQSTALESAANAIVISDPEGIIQWVNPAFKDLTGYTALEAVGESPRILNSGSHDEAFFEEMWRTIKAGNSWFGEMVNKRKNGVLYTEEMTITPVKNDDGQIANFVAIKQDITERKALEQALARANKRMAGELNVGREIQMSMVPLTFPAFPDRTEFNIHATLQPAREVGGDFYDFFFVDDDWFFFGVGDVSDKGVPAALFMAVTKTLIKSRASDDPAPASIMTRVNSELGEDNKSCMFVTVLIAALNLRTGELRYCNAGHNPPFIKRADGTIDPLDDRHGPVIGAVEDIAYKEGRTDLGRGDTIMLYTDGVTEAKSTTEGLFTEKRLTDLLSSQDYDSVEQMVDVTVQAVDQFQGKGHQADDITVLCLQYLGEPSDDNVLTVKLEIKNQLSEIRSVGEALASLAEKGGIPKAVTRKMRLVIDELLNNVVSYAFEDNSEHAIAIEMHLSSDRLDISISDDGKPFNPFEQASPDTNAALEDRDIGGLGIHLVKNIMNKVSYRRTSGENVVRLTKHLDAEANT